MSTRSSPSPSLQAGLSSSPTTPTLPQSADLPGVRTFPPIQEGTSSSSPPISTSPAPSLTHSQGSTPPPGRPPPWKPPTSSDLAFICSLPVPSVRQLVNPRHEPAGTAFSPVTQGQDLHSQTTSRGMLQGPSPELTGSTSTGAHPLVASTNTLPSIASQDFPDLNPPYYLDDPPPDPNQMSPLPLPRETILSSASREWQGMTAHGVRVQRRDTWIVGQGWGRHLRVIEGGARTTSRRGPAIDESSEAGVSRHRTW